MQPQKSGNHGFRLGSILIHSLWITGVGLVIFRLASANTQTVVYVEFLAILGTILATSPWVILLLVSTGIIFLYKAKLHDLTWLVRLPSEESSIVDEGTADHHRAERTIVIIDEISDPHLKSNKTARF
ncbi:hypothetical protein SLE2022_353010 [Rubroshorea leprosula]